MTKMKILIAGDYHSEVHEIIIENALLSLGHHVISFKWNKYFQYSSKINKLKVISKRLQDKFLIGPTLKKLNNDLFELVKQSNPHLVFIYRGTHILKQTLTNIKTYDQNIILIGYNNDDPFSSYYPSWLWRHYLKCLSMYDLVFAYRHKNVSELKKNGARRVELLRSWFDPKRNFPKKLNVNEKKLFECDVTFIGHFENDDRLVSLEEVIKRGWKLKLYGPGYEWNKVVKSSKQLKSLYPINLVWGKDYNNAICGAKIALCFMSKINNDTYTRRCFEIPASGTLLLAERTKDLSNLFIENEEAVFFDNVEELGQKINYLLNHKSEICRIAENGKKKVWAGGHDIKSRVKLLLDFVNNIEEKK